MSVGITGPSGDRSLQGSTTSKTETKGNLNVSGTSTPVINKTTKSTKSLINESAKTAPPRQSKGTRAKREASTSSLTSKSQASSTSEGKAVDAPRLKGGRGAKMAAAAQAYAPHQTSVSSSSHTEQQGAIDSISSTKEFIEHTLAEDLAGSGLLQQRRETRETDRRRRADSRTGKSEEEEEGEESHSAETGRVENIEAAQEREGGGQERGKDQELFDRLEQLARDGKINDLSNIINIAWGENGVYEDITDAYDGLRAAQKHFGEKDEDLLKNLSTSTRAAGDIFYRENGPDIRTGYLFGPGTDETISYRESVIRFEKISDSFKTIIQKVNSDPRLFNKEIDKLVKLIQIDLKAQESTLDPTHLKQIMQGLFKVQICLQVKSDCELLLRDMRNLYPST